MYDIALEILNIIDNNGFDAYIVGGYVRDKILKIESKDIDITTNATLSDLVNIFSIDCLTNENYSSFKLNYKGYLFDITTFRSEDKYIDNRRPIMVEYAPSLTEDLKRRDFTINTICIDKDGKYIDLLDGISDINNKIIRTVGNPDFKLKQDALRILRAIRFSATLNFSLDIELISAIIKNKYLIYKLSYGRKKTELEYILSSNNMNYATKLITSLGIDKTLEIEGINSVISCSSINGIWAQLNFSDKYTFSKHDKKSIMQIREIIKFGKINNKVLYKYDLDNVYIAGEILNIDKTKIINLYNNMPIYKRGDIKVSYDEIKKIYPNYKINNIYIDLEKQILYNKLKNEKKDILEYLNSNYERND